jgi:hypothetical protein
VPAETVVPITCPVPSQLVKLFSKPLFCSKFVVAQPVPAAVTLMVKLHVEILLETSFAV